MRASLRRSERGERGVITQCIVTGFGRLRAFGVEIEYWPARRAVVALDHCQTERFRTLRRRAWKEPGLMLRGGHFPTANKRSIVAT